MAKVLGLHLIEVFTFKRRKLKSYKEAESMPPQHCAPWKKGARQLPR
jgi:hypothetical protein